MNCDCNIVGLLLEWLGDSVSFISVLSQLFKDGAHFSRIEHDEYLIYFLPIIRYFGVHIFACLRGMVAIRMERYGMMC